LPFDVYFAESVRTKALKETCSLSYLHSGLRIVVLNAVLRAMGLEELATRVIVLEAQFISEEAQRDISISAKSALKVDDAVVLTL
jgi:hypothetical protein